MDTNDQILLCVDALVHCDGDVSAFHKHLNGGQRVGQAFFNALPVASQDLIKRYGADTFYNDGNIYAAVTCIIFLGG